MGPAPQASPQEPPPFYILFKGQIQQRHFLKRSPDGCRPGIRLSNTHSAWRVTNNPLRHPARRLLRAGRLYNSPERSIRFDCPATGKGFPPGSDQTSQTEVHAVCHHASPLSDHHEPGCSGGASARPADPPLSCAPPSSNSSISPATSLLSRDPAS